MTFLYSDGILEMPQFLVPKQQYQRTEGSVLINTEITKFSGSWFFPRQRRIGQHDSSSSSCPPQPLQPYPSWCQLSGDLSWRHLSSSVVDDLASLETLGFPCESLLQKSMVIHSWKMPKPSQMSASD